MCVYICVCVFMCVCLCVVLVVALFDLSLGKVLDAHDFRWIAHRALPLEALFG